MESLREFFNGHIIGNTTIHIEKYLYKKEGITIEDGQKIINEIKKRMNIPYLKVQLNFSEVRSVSRAFLETIFDGLVFEYPKPKIDQRILTRGLRPSQLAFILEVMRNAAKIRYNPELNYLKRGK